MTTSTIRLALLREAALAAQLLGSGVTSLGRACTAYSGYYAEAFFALSQGFERAAKIIIVGNHMLDHSGKLPSDRTLKEAGHKINELLAVIDRMTMDLRPNTEYVDRPASSIHQGIVDTLDEFARVTRYYNLNLLSSTRAGPAATDPIVAWRRRVGNPILKAHQSLRDRARNVALGNRLATMIGDITTVQHIAEDGTTIDNLQTMTLHGGDERLIQKWGQLYTLQLIRWMSHTVRHIANHGAYDMRIEALLGLDEFFARFLADDTLLRSRKTWSIYQR